MTSGQSVVLLAMDEQAWHQRFVLQTLWTKPLRKYLYHQLHLDSKSVILDVGCGTGALLAENLNISSHVVGLDNDYKRCALALSNYPSTKIITADAYHLPFRSHLFDLSFCHYLLLWLQEPISALKEMKRVTRSGGAVIAFAEPDYQARIDYPDLFQEIGRMQNQSLENQGVILDTGRRLRLIFEDAGLENITMGMLSGEWKQNLVEQFELEWQIIANDLAPLLQHSEIKDLKAKAKKAWQESSAMTFIPTFYAIGHVP